MDCSWNQGQWWFKSKGMSCCLWPPDSVWFSHPGLFCCVFFNCLNNTRERKKIRCALIRGWDVNTFPGFLLAADLHWEPDLSQRGRRTSVPGGAGPWVPSCCLRPHPGCQTGHRPQPCGLTQSPQCLRRQHEKDQVQVRHSEWGQRYQCINQESAPRRKSESNNSH